MRAPGAHRADNPRTIALGAGIALLIAASTTGAVLNATDSGASKKAEAAPPASHATSHQATGSHHSGRGSLLPVGDVSNTPTPKTSPSSDAPTSTTAKSPATKPGDGTSAADGTQSDKSPKSTDQRTSDNTKKSDTTTTSNKTKTSDNAKTSDKSKKPGKITYVVKKGDNLFVIAAWFHQHGYGSLYEQNKSVIGDNPDLIFPGQHITVSRGGAMTLSG